MTTFAQLLAGRSDTARPYLTWLTPQHRTELSLATFAQGAAKAGNALLELECTPGSTIAMHLPWHWQRAIWCAGAWLVGATVVPYGDPTDAALVLADPVTAREFSDSTAIGAVSLHPLGLTEGVPLGTEDVVTMARLQPDVFIGAPVDDHDALIMDGVVWTQTGLAQFARNAAHGSRMGVYDDPASWITTVWVPVVSGTSVVMLEADLDDALVDAEQLG